MNINTQYPITNQCPSKALNDLHKYIKYTFGSIL